MNNEILSCAGNRNTSENAQGEIRAEGCSCRGSHLRDARGGGLFPQAVSYRYFRSLVCAEEPDGRVRALAVPSPITREKTRYKLYVSLQPPFTPSPPPQNHPGCSASPDDDEKDDNGATTCCFGRQHLWQRETTELPRTFI